MAKKFYTEAPFLLKIATLFFVLFMGFISPKYIDKKDKNLTVIENVNLASVSGKALIDKAKN